MRQLDEENKEEKTLFEQLLDDRPATEQFSHRCRCTKIDCLKLYCECFARGKVCNAQCGCVGCHNTSGFAAEIAFAQQVANYRKPNHFVNVPAYVPLRKCTCKKSACRKNYCECFRAGEKCTEHCQCAGCTNCNQCGSFGKGQGEGVSKLDNRTNRYLGKGIANWNHYMEEEAVEAKA